MRLWRETEGRITTGGSAVWSLYTGSVGLVAWFIWFAWFFPMRMIGRAGFLPENFMLSLWSADGEFL